MSERDASSLDELRLEIESLRAENRRLRSQLGKARGERIVVIGREAVRALDRYLRYRDGGSRYGKSLRPHHSAHLPNLWLGPKGAFTESGMGQMIHDRAVAAGLGNHVHPHMFRRTYAHKMLAGGMNETDLETCCRCWLARGLGSPTGAVRSPS